MSHLILADVAPPWLDPGNIVPALIGLAFLTLVGLAIRKMMKRGGSSAEPLKPQLPAEKPSLDVIKEPELPKVSLPKSAAEEAKLAVAEEARLKAEALKAERQKLEQSGDEAAAKKLKEAEEEARKAAYRAEKSAEVEEKERKKREREEAERLKAEELERAKREAEEAAQAAAAAAKAKVDAEAGQTLSAGLKKTRNEGFMARLNGLFGGGPKAIADKVLAELEEVLFTADIGVKTASALVEFAREKAKSKDTTAEGLKALMRKEIERIVDLKSPATLRGGGPPHVVMVVGVNGAGKTTTIGKLAAKSVKEGRKVLLGAGDTFRAAAAEQLEVWSARAGATIIQGKADSDPAAVVFEAVKAGKEQGVDLVIADTAGRLHTKTNLMEELKKVKRVCDKALPGAPHEVLLVLDSTNGQNAIMQARQFHEAVGVTGIALTKLDGTAKGGVIIGICDELKVPVLWVGVGEKVEDLRPFNPKEFVAALFEND